MATSADALAEASRHLAQGELDAAAQVASSVLTAEANHPGALLVLGRIALQRGDVAHAIDHFNHSILFDGTNAPAWCGLGDAHVALGDYQEAAANYGQAVRLRPEYGEAWNQLGICLQKLGEWAQAEACHSEALRLSPASAAVHNDLANALKGRGELGRARILFERALALEPENAVIAYNLGTTLYALDDLDGALAYYRQALRHRPSFADAANNLAHVLKQQGKLDEAAAQFQETLQLRPDHALAYHNLSELAGAGFYRFTPEELGRLKAIVERQQLETPERSTACFALAAEYDRQGAYQEAFAHYQKANDLRRNATRQGAAFDAQRHEALVERIIANFDRAYFERVRGWGLDTELAVFLVGMPRSGSTLVEQILASHPQVHGAGELSKLPGSRGANGAGPGNNFDALHGLPHARAAGELARDFLQHLGELGKGAARVTVKTLENTLRVGVIATLFPRARIVYCRRQPLDVCLSCYFTNFESVPFAWSLSDIGRYYRALEKLMGHWNQVLPGKIHEVSYEELVRAQEAVSRRLVAHCGLEWDERCLGFFHTRRAVRTASAVQVRKPISTGSVGRWQRYRPYLGPLLEALGEVDARGASMYPAIGHETIGPESSSPGNVGARRSLQ
jgi:tetratricopeptide (TPR) repeat protein